MSKKKKARTFQFAGYTLSRSQHGTVVNIISMTTGRYGMYLKKFKTEAKFWNAVEFISGLRRRDGEDFYIALSRISASLRDKGPEGRRAMFDAIDAAKFCDTFGIERHDVVTFEQIQKNAAKYGQRLSDHSRPTVIAKDEFYASWEWRTLRMEVIKEQGTTCNCCGASKGNTDMAGKPVKIVVDHIKPLSKHWDLRLEKSNLQILCDECNMGKGNWDETDFRQPAAPDEWITSDCGVDPGIIRQLTDPTTGTLQ